MEKWTEVETIATWIILGLAVIAFLIYFMVKMMLTNFRRQIEMQRYESKLQFEHQKKLIETSVDVQERERSRIAADLHDSLIGKLTTLRLKNQMGVAEDLDFDLQECIAEARRISHDLTPPMIDHMDIEDLIENTVASWNDHFDINYHSLVEAVKISSDYKIQIVRIIQESLVNINKHAFTNQVDIGLRISQERIKLTISDKGKGFDMSKHSNGLGLSNIQVRVKYLNGHSKMKSFIGKGTTSIFYFPLSEIEPLNTTL